MPGETAPQHREDPLGLAHRQGGLGRVGEIVAIGHLERLGLGDGLDQDHRALGQLAHGSDHFRVAAMSDQKNGPAVLVVPLDPPMDLADQGAGGIRIGQMAAFRLSRHPLRHAVRREHHERLIRHLVELLDEHRALGPQLVHHMTIVHDLVAHVDRRPVLGERLLDDLDGALDPRAEPARTGQQDVQLRAGHMAGHSPRRAWVPEVAGLPWPETGGEAFRSRTRPVLRCI